MAKMVTLTINDVPVSVPEGTLIVDAARKAGIDIPVFCYHPKMEPVGMCRQCLVEIGRPTIDRATGTPVLDENGRPRLQFMPKLETACTNPVSQGMVVLTASEKALSGQKEIIELLLTNHPLDCPVCDKGGECPLQNLTMAYGSSQSRFIFDEKQHAAKHYPLGELIFLDRERCIQCARCIRFQKDIAGEPVLGFYQRGRATDIVTYSEPGFDSIFSGNTTDICPVGALTTADFRFGARPWEMKHAASICGQCAVGCNITFNVRREARARGGYAIKRVMPRQNEQVNEIWMCDKGRFAAHHFSESPERLTQTADEYQAALHAASEKLAQAGAEALILAGGRLSNEDLYNLKTLAAGLGGRAVLYTPVGGGEHANAGVALGDLKQGDTILVVAADIHDEAPVWYLRLKAAAQRGATLIVAGARATKLEEYAAFVVRYAYGDEIETVRGLAAKEKIGAALQAGRLAVFFGGDGLGPQGSAALSAELAAAFPAASRFGVWNAPNTQGAYELGFAFEPDLKSALKGRTVYIVAADPVGDDPLLAEAVASASFVIAQDVLASATTRRADVVLAAQAYSEREGTFTSAERRVQRFYPAVPALPGTRADFAITADVAARCGIELEGRSPLLVMKAIAAGGGAFAGISYARLAEVTEQFPIIGRGDLYYGGTGYENKQGLGVTLAPAAPAAATPVRRAAGLRPKENELLAVPVSRVYDLGATMQAAVLLRERTGPASAALHPAAAARLGLSAGSAVVLDFNGTQAQAVVRLDDSIAAGVVLVSRSFGIPISEPTSVRILAAEKA